VASTTATKVLSSLIAGSGAILWLWQRINACQDCKLRSFEWGSWTVSTAAAAQ